MPTPLIGRVLLAAALAAAPAAQAQSSVYRWVGPDGTVHYSDTPPPPEAREVRERRMGAGASDAQLPYATREAMKRNPVTLYIGGDACGNPCREARALLAARGIPHAERNAELSAEDNAALRGLAGVAEVPFLLVGRTKLKGYDEDAWQAALDAAGYPRTVLPGQRRALQAGPPAPAGTAEAPGAR